MVEPNERQLAVLKAVHTAGGFLEEFDDTEAAEQCDAHGWLLAEDHRGYALTLEGREVLMANGG